MKLRQNNSLSKFINYKKFTFIIPAILLAIALFIFAIWGVNRGYDYKESYTYNIHFNTSVSSKDFQTYKDVIVNTFKNESDGDFVVKLSKVNDDISSACKVNVYNNTKLDNEAFEEKINDINEVVETKLNQLSESRTVRITEVNFQQASTYGKTLLNSSIAVLILLVIAFVYYFFRFGLKIAFASLIIAPYVFINMLSLMVIFRIPFTANFMLPSLFAVIVGYLLFTLLFDNIRQNLENKDNNMTNDDLVYGSIKNNSTTLMSLISIISLILVLLTFVLNVGVLFLCITLILGIVIAIYSGIILPGTLWAMIYNKEKDNRLKARLKILETRAEKKNSKNKKKENG